MGKRRPYRKWDGKNYVVYDLNGEEVFRGGVRDICKRLDITPSNISHAVTYNRKVGKKYRIVYVED